MSPKNRAAARFRKYRRLSRDTRAFVFLASCSAIVCMQGNAYQCGNWQEFNLICKWQDYKYQRRYSNRDWWW